MILVGKPGSGRKTFAKMFPELTSFSISDNVKKVIKVAQIQGEKKAVDYIQNKTGKYDRFMKYLLSYAYSCKGYGINDKIFYVVKGGFMNIDPYFWVDWLDADIQDAHNPPYIITDVMYHNEFDHYKNDISIFIDCNTKARKKRLMKDGINVKNIGNNEVDLFCNQCTYIVKNHRNVLKELREKANLVKKRQYLLKGRDLYKEET